MIAFVLCRDRSRRDRQTVHPVGVGLLFVDYKTELASTLSVALVILVERNRASRFGAECASVCDLVIVQFLFTLSEIVRIQMGV